MFGYFNKKSNRHSKSNYPSFPSPLSRRILNHRAFPQAGLQLIEFGLAFIIALFGVYFVMPSFVDTATANIIGINVNVLSELMLFAGIIVCSLTFFKSVDAQARNSAPYNHYSELFLYNLISLFAAYASVLFLNLVVTNAPSKYYKIFQYYFSAEANLHSQDQSLLVVKIFYLILCCIALLSLGKYFFKKQISHQYVTLAAFLCWSGLFVMSLNNIMYILVIFDVSSLLTIAIVVMSTTPSSTKTLNYSLSYLCLSVLTSFAAYFGTFLIHTSLQSLNINAILLSSKCANMEIYFNNNAFILGAFLILIKFIFLLGLFPFQQYVIEITSVANFGFLIIFLVISKLPVLVCFASLLKILWLKFFAFKTFIFLVGFSSIIFSALFIATCTKIKTFFAYSSINQGGFVLILFYFEDIISVVIAAQFFATYAVASALIFLVLSSILNISRVEKIPYENDLDTWSDLARAVNDSWDKAISFPHVGSAFYSARWNLILSLLAATIALLTLAGFPPLAGFFLKLSFIEIFLTHKFVFTLCVIMFSSLITMYAYFNVVMIFIVEAKPRMAFYQNFYTKVFHNDKIGVCAEILLTLFLIIAIFFVGSSSGFWCFAEKIILYFYDVNFFNFDAINEAYIVPSNKAVDGSFALLFFFSNSGFKTKMKSFFLKLKLTCKNNFSLWRCGDISLLSFLNTILSTFSSALKTSSTCHRRITWKEMETELEVPVPFEYPAPIEDEITYDWDLERPFTKEEMAERRRVHAKRREIIRAHELKYSNWFIGNSFWCELTIVIALLSPAYFIATVWAWDAVWNCFNNSSTVDVSSAVELFELKNKIFWMMHRVFIYMFISYLFWGKLLGSFKLYRYSYFSYMFAEVYCLMVPSDLGVQWYWTWAVEIIKKIFSFFGCEDLLAYYFKSSIFWVELFYCFMGLPFVAFVCFIVYSGWNSFDSIKKASFSIDNSFSFLRAFRELLIAFYENVRVMCYSSAVGGRLLDLGNLLFVWFLTFGPFWDVQLSTGVHIGPFLIIKSIYMAIKFLSFNFFIIYFLFNAFLAHCFYIWMNCESDLSLFRSFLTVSQVNNKDFFNFTGWRKIASFLIYIFFTWVIPATIALSFSIHVSLWNIYTSFLFEINTACWVWVGLSGSAALGLAICGDDSLGSNLLEFKKACLSAAFGISVFFLNLSVAYYLEGHNEILSQKRLLSGSVPAPTSSPVYGFSIDGFTTLATGEKFSMFTFGYDYLTLAFCSMTSIVFTFCFMAILFSKNIKHERLFCFLLFLIEINILAAFLSVNLLSFFIFFEASLIPLAVLIGKWGSSAKKWFAAKSFLMYSLIGSLPMTIFVVYLYSYYGALDYVHLVDSVSSLTASEKYVFWFCLFFMLAVKVPIFPFHSWLLNAHVEAPMVGSIILAAVTLKLGVYGIIRFLLGTLHDISVELSPLVCSLCLIGIFFSAVASITEVDAKKLIAQTSIAHMNLVVLGLFIGDSRAFFGAILLAIGHAVTSTALFYLIGILYDRFHTRELDAYGGLVQLMPLFSTTLFFFVFANAGFPWSLSFLGEFMILIGIGRELSLFVFAILIVSSVLLLYSNLRLFIFICFGTLNKDLISNSTSDLTELEALCAALLIGFSFSLLLNSFTLFNPIFTDFLLKCVL